MSETVFADSFYYFALINPNDAAHEIAVAYSRRADARILTTAWIIQELADALSPAKRRSTFAKLLAAIRADERTELLPPDAALWSEGLDLYLDRPDKDWSLTDCISFAVMGQRCVGEALTGDHHFRQAGFVPLLVRP